ncbi:MAG: hypothetical protein PWQ51_1674 [Methanolobus sp.]|jgi:hypothetical protein|uniref:hypothetical protein n=1 Tax=Methanolobus sp. TaxID=1874737 RepID=UPI0024AAB531|nr:hypothetical protein [Methanolobus sp.]MDI3484888.1 hypothetical protein [Methanolobus sp.]MDK2831262.1 hypothetical protein [Methanolobus sp.]MDK2939509.1 hypothetical protein [Methanolobus sp.]
MKMNEKIKVSAIFMALLVVSLAFIPAVSAKTDISWYEQMLESKGITIHDIDVKMTNYEEVGDEIYYSGDFKIDVEKEVDNKLKKLKTKGTMSGTTKADGSTHVEYVGNNFNFVMDSSIIEEKQESVLFSYEQSLTVDGITTNSTETIEVSKAQINAINQETSTSSISEESVAIRSTKIDVISAAPLGSILIYNDLQYADLLVTGGIIIPVLAYFGLAPAAALATIAAAVLAAVPEYLDINYRDIYLDFFITPQGMMFVEVDYFYI